MRFYLSTPMPQPTAPLPASGRLASASRRLLRQSGLVLAAGWTLLGAQPPANPPAARAEGFLDRRTVTFTAPTEACESYYETFRTRTWRIGVTTPAAFDGLLAALPLTETHRLALLNPTWRSAHPEGGFEIRPTDDFLRSLAPGERAALYALLARWETNKPERWPLVFADAAALRRLQKSGRPPEMLRQVEAWAYPFAGGLAFSDFSLLAAAFPDRAMLVGFLQDASASVGLLPRLKLRHALSVGSALAYWTVDNNNSFARPMLEALLQAETDEGIELTTIFPGAMRVLAHDITPDQVRRDFSLRSLVISAGLSGGPQLFDEIGDFEPWFHRNFTRVSAPFRFGDVLVLERPAGLPVRYACAYIADDLAFAKDPVGLGLWGFLPLDDILRRNPHFAGGTWAAYRRRDLAAGTVGTGARFQTGAPGPWGVLRSAALELDPPERWLDLANIFQPQPWEFTGGDWGRVEALLRRCQLTPAQLDVLLNPAIRSTRPNGRIVLAVPARLRLELSATSRALLYDELGSRGNNPSHYIPLVLPDDAALERAGLNPALREALHRISYVRHDRRCLSDTDLLEPYLTDPREARRLKSLLLGAPALQAELSRESLAYRREVIAYWKKSDGRTPAALLGWFEHSPDLEAIDLINFLPELPQQVLNTFPETVARERTNCYWTSFNFFARQPDNRFLSSALAGPNGQQLILEELRRAYHPVDPPYQFGDIVCYMDTRPDGYGIIHMMNYIADDVVLTKNGLSALAPTVFMRLSDVGWRYPTTFQLGMGAFRRNPIPAAP